MHDELYVIHDMKTLNDVLLDIIRAANAVSPYLGYYVGLFLQTSYLVTRHGTVLHITITVSQDASIYARTHL